MKKILLPILTLPLIACGGGDGDSTSSDTPTVPDTELLRITSENADLASGIAFVAIAAISEINSSLPDLTVRSGNESVIGAKANFSSVYNSAFDMLIADASNTSDGIQPRAVITEDCPYGGTLVINYDFGSDDIPNQTGEYVDIDFNICFIESNSSADGNLKLAISSWSSDLNFSADATVNISFNTDGFVETYNGNLVSSLYNNGETVALTSKAFVYSYGSETLGISDLDAIYDSSTAEILGDISFMVSSTEIDASLIISTEELLSYGLYDYYPTLGVVKASGADNTYVLLDADTGDYNTVYQTVNDGSSAVTSEVDWSTLESLVY